MATQLPSPLPQSDRNLLRAAERIVPHAEREEWRRVWHAELWHMRHCNRITRRTTADLSTGLICDALWLRSESWRLILSGTAALCVASLCGLLLVSTLLALALNGNWHSMTVNLADQFHRFLFEAPLVIVVNCGLATRLYCQRSSRTNPSAWLMRQLFFAAKATLTLLLAFVLSADICQPVYTVFPLTADLLQTFLFTILALIGLRWVIRDQDDRCKKCLRVLATPARIGRPSHNLLEWNGTELACKRGHGLLSVPEMETSWCQSSRWVEIRPNWNHPASV